MEAASLNPACLVAGHAYSNLGRASLLAEGSVTGHKEVRHWVESSHRNVIALVQVEGLLEVVLLLEAAAGAMAVPFVLPETGVFCTHASKTLMDAQNWIAVH